MEALAQLDTDWNQKLDREEMASNPEVNVKLNPMKLTLAGRGVEVGERGFKDEV